MIYSVRTTSLGTLLHFCAHCSNLLKRASCWLIFSPLSCVMFPVSLTPDPALWQLWSSLCMTCMNSALQVNWLCHLWLFGVLCDLLHLCHDCLPSAIMLSLLFPACMAEVQVRPMLWGSVEVHTLFSCVMIMEVFLCHMYIIKYRQSNL